MSARKTILILCDWFLPGYLAGGPIQSIATLTKQLGKEVDFKIITTDRDFKSLEPYKEISTNVWTTYEGRSVFYVSPENNNAPYILNLIQATVHDVIYLNSLFSKSFTINPLRWHQQGLISSQLVLAPRGMLGDGALAIKPLKKHVFLWYAKMRGWFKNVHWQSTSAQETMEIKKRIGKNSQVFEVSNFPNNVEQLLPIEKISGELKLCFISRISEKKNLKFALHALHGIKAGSVVFDVYGPIENEIYWNDCIEMSKLLPSNVSFKYKGILKPAQIGAVLSQYHALFLPTLNENYGHVIVEALQHARPVILSDQTPWRDLVKHQVGYDIALLNEEEFEVAINQLMSLQQNEYDKISASCLTYIDQQLNVNDIKTKYIKLFNV